MQQGTSKSLFNGKTLLILSTAFILAMLVILPSTKEILPFSIIYSGFRIADVLFHELGHSIFNWLFGMASVPAIFTIFGADQAGGVSLSLERSWFIQIGAFFALAYFSYWIWKHATIFLIPFLIFSIAIIAISFTHYYRVVPIFMGHGGAILAGTFFLFRAVLFIGPNKIYERWLNAFFGFFLICNNIFFAWNLIADSTNRMQYSEKKIFGAFHHDLFALTEEVFTWSVTGCAYFLIFFGVFAMLTAFILPVFIKDYFYTNDEFIKPKY